MKVIKGINKYNPDREYPIAYLLEKESEIEELALQLAHQADLGHCSGQKLLDEELTENGKRPSGSDFPVIAVPEVNSEYNVLEFTYITKSMFDL